MKQEYTSAKTSVNTIPSVFKKCEFIKRSTVLDYGGGKYDTAKGYMEITYAVKFFIYDPYNRSEEHNQEVIDTASMLKGFDYITCNNVLNVLYEEDVIISILEGIKRLYKGTGKIYIQVYEGDRMGIGKKTTKGYQRNQKAADYECIIRAVYSKGYEISRKANIYTIGVMK